MTSNDLDVLDPTGRNVTVAGQTVSIVPLTVAQIFRFARAIRHVPQVFTIRSPAPNEVTGSSPTPVLTIQAGWLGLVADHGDSIIEAAAVATEIPSEELGVMPADQFIDLCAAIVEVNIDFFVHRLGPAIERASEQIVKAIPGAGAIPSKPS